MRKEFTYLWRLFLSICAAVLISICTEGCANGQKEDGPQPGPECGSETGSGGTAESREPLCLRLSGSTSMEKLSNAWAERFMEKYPQVSVTTEFTGSSAGIEAVLSGSADIGNSSRNLQEEEKAGGAVENLVAVDGIAVCVDPSNRVEDLTMGQLADIYTGTVRGWSDAGGADLPVVVLGRDAGSGIRSVFEEALEVEELCDYANELDSNGAMMARVASVPGAIGYISLDMVDDTVKVLSLGGVEPSAEHIRDGSYPLSVPLIMVTRGSISEQDKTVRLWFDFVYSEEGQMIAEQLGYIGIP